MRADNYWVYILYCANGSYYTGYTNDLKRRYQEHLAGKCKYTRSFKPISIAQSWLVYGNKSIAMQIEAFIKKQSRNYKEQLVQSPQSLTKIFAEAKAL